MKQGRESCQYLGKEPSQKNKSKSKVPEDGTALTCMRSSKEQ